MERITISLKPDLASQFDQYIGRKGYSNRSEAMRDLIRDRLDSDRLKQHEDGHCISVLSYVFDFREMDLANRLAATLHQHHDMCVAVQHVPLDHRQALHTVVLKGLTLKVRALADAIIAERGVRNGHLMVTSVHVEMSALAHEEAPHMHFHPMT